MPNLYEVLARVRSHATTDEDAEWLENEFDHFGLLLDCHNQHYRDLLASWEENADLRAKLAAWDRWEHAWVFGGDAAYPGRAGVTDPRETVDDLERALQGEEIEEAEDA